MNPTHPQHPWARLTAAARTVPDDRATEAPHGFATRVAAFAFAQERPMTSLFEHFAWRAVGVAGLLAVLAVAVNYSALSRPVSPVEESFTDDDPVVLLLKVD